MKPVRIEFGYAAGCGTRQCAKRVDVAHRMLCDRRVAYIPAVQPPFRPEHFCPDCRRVLDGGVTEFVPPTDEQAEGTCPVCVGRVLLDEQGRISVHGEWSYRGGALVVTEKPCAGAGEKPEAES